jgi:hypothetical protein
MSNKLSETVAVPLGSAIVSYGAVKMMYPDQTFKLPAVGSIDAAMGIGVTTGVSSAVGLAFGNYALPYLGPLGKFANAEKRIGAPLLAAGTAAGVTMLGGNEGGAMTSAVIGGGSHIVSQYVFDSFMK